MIDHRANLLALRARLLGLSVCTTGAIALSATSTGYARAAGSFITDGFAVGMEVLASSFANGQNNGLSVITGVTALALIVNKVGGTVVETAGTRTLAVGLPSTRIWENVQAVPAQGSPYLEEEYTPGPAPVVTTLSPNGRILARPQYDLRIYGVSNDQIGAPYRYADAILALFPPEQLIALSNGDFLHVRADVAPNRGSLRQDSPGYACVPISIPLRLYTLNAI